MSNGLLVYNITGAGEVDLTAYRGHLCLVTANIDGNGYLSLSGMFVINQRYIENFASHQYDATAGIYISFENNNGKYHLRSAKWGDTDYLNNTSMTFIVF